MTATKEQLLREHFADAFDKQRSLLVESTKESIPYFHGGSDISDANHKITVMVNAVNAQKSAVGLGKFGLFPQQKPEALQPESQDTLAPAQDKPKDTFKPGS